jgi:3-phytase
MRRARLAAALAAGLLAACSDDPSASPDSGAPVDGTPTVTARGETSGSGGDPDDPAIWVDPVDPAQSRIYGTDKHHGIFVYDLDGTMRQDIPDGDMNSVDLRDRFSLGGETITLVTAGNRSNNSIAFYAVVPGDGMLVRLPPFDGIPTGITIYGSCMGRGADGTLYLVLDDKEGTVVQWRIADDGRGGLAAEELRRFDAGGQLEGCVIDDELGQLYLGEEDVGIWRYLLDPAAPASEADRSLVAAADGTHITADVEGLTIYRGATEDSGYLLASSQGDSSYAIFERQPPNRFVGRFRIGAGVVDAASESDGIDVIAAPLGDRFPHGLFVAHDTRNEGFTGDFKLVGWEEIAASADPALLGAP